jgi:hypothetical protein
MEATSNECRARLQVVPGGRDDAGVADRDREREEVEGVAARLRQAVRNLPSRSPWLLPFRRLLRAIREGLRRSR